MVAHEFSSHDGKFVVASFRLKKDDGGMRAHEHDYPHDAFIVEGVVSVNVGGLIQTVEAPSTIRFPGGVAHAFMALSEEASVICLHEARFLKQS